MNPIMGNMTSEQFTFFWRGIYSQWWTSSFEVDGILYNCAEQFMMAEKARLFNDPVALKKIMAETNPHQQKMLGKTVKGFKQDVWDNNARRIVYNGNYAKFTQNAELKALLLSSVGTLVEASPYDKIWGIGLSEREHSAKIRSQWKGTNWLGEVLTKLRANLATVITANPYDGPQ